MMINKNNFSPVGGSPVGRKISILEIAAVAVIFLILIGFQWRVIGAKETMSTHDALLTYSAFYSFSDSLLRGHFSYWDPYTNAGESRFMLWQLSYFLRPTVFIWLLLAKIFNISLFTAYHLEIFTIFIIFCLGSYLFFKNIFQSKISAYIVFIIITFSSLSMVYWWQSSYIMVLYTLPWVLLFTFQFIEGRKKALIPLAFFLGISLLGIHSLFFIFYCFILLLTLLITGAISRQNIAPVNYRYLVFSFLILILLTLYIWSEISYKDDIIPTLRIMDDSSRIIKNISVEDDSSRIIKDISVKFEGLYAAAHSKIFDFFGLLLPQFSRQFFFETIPWMPAQDTVMYIGLIPLILLFIGLFWGKNKYKLAFIFTTVIIMFLMQGTNSFVLQFAYYFFPKFSWIESMALFYGFFIFSLCFFVGLGMDKILEDARSHNENQFKKYYTLILALAVFYFVTVGGLLAGTFLFLKKYLGVFLRQKETSGVWLAEKLSAIYPLLLEMFFYTQFFLLIFLIFLHLLKKREFSFKNRILFITFFIVCDLLIISYPILNYTTMRRIKGMPEYSTKIEYKDFRLRAVENWQKEFHFYPSAMLKQFSAYDPDFKGWPFHIFELKNYYNFGKSDIPEKTKDAILGITFPKLRLFNQAVVGSPDKIIDFIDNYSADQIGKIEVTKFDQNRLELKVSTEQDSILYYSDGYDKYWQAYIDGKKTEIYKTNMAFKSIILPAGEHAVKFIYRPLLFMIGLYCYLATWILGLVWCIYWLVKKIVFSLKIKDKISS